MNLDEWPGASLLVNMSITGNDGHDENDVMYIGSPESAAETVNKIANWGAKSFNDFESSIEADGDQLTQRLS